MERTLVEPSNQRRKLIGTDVGPYRIAEELGVGGMGSVYKAIDRALERPVALKILFDLEDPENVDRFRREAKALAKLGHPNTIQIFWVGEIDGFPCFAMEYSEGISVYDLLKERGVLPTQAATDIVIQAARGLEAAQRAGVVHRDIKPNNLLITADGTIKIADFGLAKLTQETTSQLTESGIVMGTPYYMSPEQGQGQAVDHRSDLYSLGATFYHMLTGFTPYESNNPVSLIIKHVKDPIPDLRRVSPSTPDILRRIIEKMLAKDPRDRYSEYEQLIEDLERYQKGSKPTHAKSFKSIPARIRSAPVWSYLIGGILVGTGLMAGISRMVPGHPAQENIEAPALDAKTQTPALQVSDKKSQEVQETKGMVETPSSSNSLGTTANKSQEPLSPLPKETTQGEQTKKWWQGQFKGAKEKVSLLSKKKDYLIKAIRYHEQRYSFTRNTNPNTLKTQDQKVFKTLYTAALNDSTQVEKELLEAKTALDTLSKEADKNQISSAWR